jgi:sugar (pentulose or hexulose) kinase
LSSKPLFLGIDISATSAKALFMDDPGAVVATASSPLTLSTPKPLWSEQNPEEWWPGVGAGIWSDVPAVCTAGGKIACSTPPDPGQVEVYRRAYPLYRELYPGLKPGFDRMSA